MKKKNQLVKLTLLVFTLACTGCGNAVSIGDSQVQKENAGETVKVATDFSEDIQQESVVPDIPEGGEIPENITSLLDTAASAEESKDIAASDEESEDTNKEDLSMEDVSRMKEDITNENTGLETNLDTQSIYEITNGNTGKRITLNDAWQLECMDALLENMTIQKEESRQSDAEKPVGYLYRIRVLNENGDVSKTITLNGSHVEIDGKYYIVESTEDLVAYLNDLYK